MLPVTEKRDDLVLNAVSFFYFSFLARERLVQKNKKRSWTKNNTTNF